VANSLEPMPSPPPGMEVFVPPDIKYWASGDLNSTVLDKMGLPWFCYTVQQTHCVPLFRKPTNFRTTRMPVFKRVNNSPFWTDCTCVLDEHILLPFQIILGSCLPLV
jgi:hypothetical protein